MTSSRGLRRLLERCRKRGAGQRGMGIRYTNAFDVWLCMFNLVNKLFFWVQCR